jgi:hypothetical protein
MKKLIISFLFSALMTNPIFAAAITPLFTPETSLNTAMIQRLVGAQGKFDSDQNYKISLPRDDLNITVNGVKISAAMGLTSWVSFKKVDDLTTEMQANLVLTEDQINSVMQEAIDNHLNVVELHNHLMWESPKVMFMHIEGTGDTKTLATAVAKVFDKVKETSAGQGDFPIGEIDATNTTFNQRKLENILGARGKISDGVYHVSIDRQPKDAIGDAFAARTNAAATFAGTEEAAVLDGDLAMQQPNLSKVLTALHKAGISVVAINQRMVNDKTNYVFLHYWGIGKPGDLAKGLRNALDASQQLAELTPAEVTASKLKSITMSPALVIPPIFTHNVYSLAGVMKISD